MRKKLKDIDPGQLIFLGGHAYLVTQRQTGVRTDNGAVHPLTELGILDDEYERISLYWRQCPKATRYRIKAGPHMYHVEEGTVLLVTNSRYAWSTDDRKKAEAKLNFLKNAHPNLTYGIEEHTVTS